MYMVHGTLYMYAPLEGVDCVYFELMITHELYKINGMLHTCIFYMHV